jgi:hypothetical protein
LGAICPFLATIMEQRDARRLTVLTLALNRVSFTSRRAEQAQALTS